MEFHPFTILHSVNRGFGDIFSSMQLFWSFTEVNNSQAIPQRKFMVAMYSNENNNNITTT